MVRKSIFLDNLTIEVEKQVALIHNEYNKLSKVTSGTSTPEIGEPLDNLRMVMKNSILPIKKAAVLALTAGFSNEEVDDALEPYNVCLDVMSKNVNKIYDAIYTQLSLTKDNLIDAYINSVNEEGRSDNND